MPVSLVETCYCFSMTRERVAKPTLTSSADAASKTVQRVRQTVSQARALPSFALTVPTPVQLEGQRQQTLELQRQADLQQSQLEIQRFHDTQLSQARVSQATWRTSSLKIPAVQRALTDHTRTARVAADTRAAFVAQRSQQHLERLVTQRLQTAVLPEVTAPPRGQTPSLGYVAEIQRSRAEEQVNGDPNLIRNYQGFKNAGATLVKHFRSPGSSHSMTDLAGAIQRFTDPGQRGAVESAAFAALGHHPSFPGQLQRALDAREEGLEGQRETWQRELEPIAQRQALEEASGEGAAGLIEQARGGGQPLPENVRAMLEVKWNVDLSKVRVHLDSSADGISRKLNAKALTAGNDIFFRAGTWNPTSLEGLQLIGHETWHTQQQANGLVQAGVDKDCGLELEARDKGSQLSSTDLSSVSSAKTKSAENATSKLASAFGHTAPSKAMQRQPDGATTARGNRQPTPEGVLVPISASVDTPKELMVNLLEKLGYDRALAQQHTDQKGKFSYGDDSRSWSFWRKPTTQELRVGAVFVSLSAGEQTQTRATASGANQQYRSIRSTSRSLGKQGASATNLKTVSEQMGVGLVFNPDGVNLYRSPNTSGKDKPTQRLAFNTKALVVRELEGGWYQLSLSGGGTGYANKSFMRLYPDDPGASLHQVSAGQSAVGVAEQYYRRFAQPGMDLRYFVNVLARVNPNALKNPDAGNWKDAAFNQNVVIYVPGIQRALALRDQVNDGSLTNGAYASITNGMGRIGDLVKSVLESPQFIGEVLGELWEVIKPKLPEFIAITAALIAAELTVSALAAAPEPTMITKVVAMLLQGAILLFAGYGAAVSLYSALTEGASWIKTAWNANGKYDQVKLASKAFLRMVGSIALAVLAIMGVRGSLGRFRGLYTKFKAQLPKVESEPTIASPLKGNPKAIWRGYASLSRIQQEVLNQLPGKGSQKLIPKGIFKLKDLAALSASTGDEFAMFTMAGRRLIMRGTRDGVPVNQELAASLAKKGWRWSAHTHPDGSLRSSAGDRLILSEFGNKQSAILTSEGTWKLFNQNGDLINSSWLP